MKNRSFGKGILAILGLVFASGIGVRATTWNFQDEILGTESSDHRQKVYETGVSGADLITLDGTITVSGEIVFVVQSGGVMTISVGDITDQPVFMHATSTYTILGDVIEPIGDPIANPALSQISHLIFAPEANGQIVFDVTQDFYLTGSNIAPGESIDDVAAHGSNELTMSFTGAGQTVFKLHDGKNIIFTSLHMEDEELGTPVFVENTSTGSGVSIYIGMDDTRANVVDNGVNKLIFQRERYTLGGANDSSVEFGLNSMLTFLSTNATGLDAGGESYAAVGFDVSNDDKGRLKLKMTGPVNPDTYTDGAMNICGYFVENGSGGAGSLLDPVHMRSYVNFSQQAGGKAFFRVIDEAAYAESVTYQAAIQTDGLVGGVPSRRGLLIENTCKSIPAFASDPYADSSWFYQDIIENGLLGNKPVRPGFVLGINGHIEVFHNTFFEYEASAPNQELIPATVGMTTLDTALTTASIADPGLVFKRHNGSAFIVDGLEDTFSGPTLLTNFEAHAQVDTLRHAEISLLGDAGMTVRAPLINTLAVYDGLRLPVTGETLGDGVFVMDIEGWLTVRGLDDDFDDTPVIFGRHAGSLVDNASTMRMGSLWRSYDDREIVDLLEVDPDSYVTRPLAENSSYYRYDRASIFTNASLDFSGLNFHHDDVSRDVRPDPLLAEPALVGGEKATVLSDVYAVTNPDITFFRPYNTTFHCHESFCMSGVRLTMREEREPGLDDAPNGSAIVFYNHGDELDMNRKGFGRVFMLGSKKNEVAAGGSGIYLDSAFMNIFRHNDETDHSVTLSLQTAGEFPIGVDEGEKATQVVFMGNNSYIDVGWTTTQGLKKDSGGTTIYPWDRVPLPDVPEGNNFQFSLDSTTIMPAKFILDGDLIYLGGGDESGLGSPSIITGTDLGRVIYMNHGAEIAIGYDATVTPTRSYQGFSDATIGMRVWKASETGLNTTINLPGDQMQLAHPIQPYGLDFSLLINELVETDKYLKFSALTGSGLGTEVRLAWDRINPVPGLEILSQPNFMSGFQETRGISILESPVPMPTHGMIIMETDDYLEQLIVSGATVANPFILYMSGDDNGISQVREVVSAASTYLVPGEGAHARFFMDGGARLGLGVRDWNENSDSAWNLLGKHHVSIRPNGDCVIDVNSDLLIVDPQPLIPTENFGSDNNEHRITFFSHDTREIRVPSGHEFDLSAFSAPTSTTNPFTQQIAIGGRLKLIFEPGSTLRFPELSETQDEHHPVLYINEESEIIFEGLKDLENKSDWDAIEDTDRARIRILGSGQIWLNKSAIMRVNDGAIVAVEADLQSPQTNLTISIQREAQLLIGDDNHAGGTFQVGNPEAVTGAYINFVLRQNGAKSFTHLGREGFLGFGAGTVLRASSRVNNWTVQSLFDVKLAELRLIKGTFRHNNIYDGASREGSILALGPLTATGGKYVFAFGQTESSLRGGGNLLYVTDQASAATLLTPLIEDEALALVADATLDNGKYTLTAPSVALSQVESLATQDIATVIEVVDYEAGDPFDDSLLDNGFRFSGNQADAFRYLGLLDFKVQSPSRYVALGQTQFEYRIGLVNGTAITRTANIPLLGISSPEEGIIFGALKGATIDELINPAAYTIP